MISLTPSHLIQHQYCPRYTYFEHVLHIPQNEEKYGKVMRGRSIHDQKLERNKGYLRKRIGVVNRYDDQYLTMPGLRGIIDEVLELTDNRFAPLDYKFAVWKERLPATYRLQLSCYALLVEANFPGRVEEGYLVYVRSKNKVVQQPLGPAERDGVRKLIDEVAEVIIGNRFPRATRNKKQCLTCTYRNVCTG
jgi:CRISPR-associated exonuclease Cas4